MFDCDDGFGIWYPPREPITRLMGYPLPEFLHLPRGQIGYECDSEAATIRIWTKAGAPIRYAATRRFNSMWGYMIPPIEELGARSGRTDMDEYKRKRMFGGER